MSKKKDFEVGNHFYDKRLQDGTLHEKVSINDKRLQDGTLHEKESTSCYARCPKCHEKTNLTCNNCGSPSLFKMAGRSWYQCLVCNMITAEKFCGNCGITVVSKFFHEAVSKSGSESESKSENRAAIFKLFETLMLISLIVIALVIFGWFLSPLL